MDHADALVECQLAIEQLSPLVGGETRVEPTWRSGLRVAGEHKGCAGDDGTAATAKNSSDTQAEACREGAYGFHQGELTRESVTGPRSPEGSNGESALYGSNVA